MGISRLSLLGLCSFLLAPRGGSAYGQKPPVIPHSPVSRSHRRTIWNLTENCQCDCLSAALPGLVTFPNSTLYAAENTYWSARQTTVHPDCFVTPKTTADVSTAIKILTSLNARFAVKGGGHAAFAGGSNVDKGVTIDLLRLTNITVSPDRKTVSVGAGNRWINVSQALDPLGLAVVAGRVADVGVGGVILGGGISYFSGSRGWACDNVRNYEVVLSSGQVVNASPTTNRDLYWALRGGAGTNFGVVTRFDLASFDQGDMWSNSLIFPGALNTTLIPLFQNLTVNGLPADPQAHTYFVLGNIPQLGGYIINTDQFHATPPPADTIPPVFQSIDAVTPALAKTVTVANISTMSKRIDQAYGFRQTWFDTAVSATSAKLLVDLVPLFEAFVDKLHAAANGTDVTPLLIYQPIPVNVLQAMQANGGNALGLEPSDGPLVIVQLAVSWSSSLLDGVVASNAGALIDQINRLANSRNLGNGFNYINYAEPSQQVFESYGKDNLARLRATAKKYDPEALFQNLWRGYFKLSG
ncbi:hypothetical protein B0T19DRAFT_184856 [Cercophora scortea]|uniref:FAD-binding PCMH-type domain-containing protein n=1 Tax=Cercophora scortea TaxID=314031 RepID=A0AAE0INE1_9PEZI|nr:hypothetical protein B0T19DRAFT_184856 [Cercophora scortea]